MTEPAGPEYERFEPLTARDLTPGKVLVDRYVLESALGHGGVGTVYLAFDRVGKSRIAIKCFDGGGATGPQASEGLFRELRCGRAVNHPNVCRVFDVFEANGRWFLTMEYAPGGTLRAMVGEQQARERPLADRIADARSVVSGVAAIHAAGFLHRDIKPENVLRMQDGRLVLSDFGLARPQDSSSTTVSSGGAGTPGYVAPEVAMGEEASVAADVYSLGVLLYEIFFGTRPPREMRAGGRLPSKWSVQGALRIERRVARLCAECLATSPVARPRTVEELSRGLAAAISGRRTQSRMILVSAGAIAAIGGGLVVASFGTRAAITHDVAAGTLVGEAADWSRSKVLLSEGTLCLMALPPERRVVRAILGLDSAPGAVDIDVETGAVTPSPIPSETYQYGCPQVSPDGKAILFERPIGQNRRQLMYSTHPDARDAEPLAMGSSPVWLPSGKEFLLRIEGNRVAVGNLKGERIPFPAPADTALRFGFSAAVSGGGDEIATPLLHPDGWSRLELYSYPRLSWIGGFRIEATLGETQFDWKGGRFLVAVKDSSGLVLAELIDRGTLRRIGRMPDGDIVRAVRTTRGLVFASKQERTAHLILTSPDGSEHAVWTGRTAWPSVSLKGDVVFTAWAAAGPPRGAVALRRAGEAEGRIISEEASFPVGAISRDGSRLLYKAAKGRMVYCAIGSSGPERCTDVHSDPGVQGRSGLRFSPDGEEVAYVSLDSGDSKLRVFSLRDLRARDLGMRAVLCPLQWSAKGSLWLRAGVADPWIEIDPVSGAATGNTWLPKSPASCSDSPPDDNLYRARRSLTRVSEIRLIEGI